MSNSGDQPRPPGRQGPPLDKHGNPPPAAPPQRPPLYPTAPATPPRPRQSEPSPARHHRPEARHDAATYTPVYVNQHVARARAAAEWAGVALAAVLTALLLKAYVVEGYKIPSPSMQNTLLVNDRVVVNKLAYHYGSIHRGDVFVFHKPDTETDPTIHNLIKRVIGLPGDTVAADEDGVVSVNGQPLNETYVKPGDITDGFPATTVPPGQLFVMGDHRENSTDSRELGTIDKKLLIGKAEMRAWPISRIGTL